MIFRHEQLIALETEHCSYWISLEKPYPINAYWGAKVDVSDAGLLSWQTSHSSFDADILSERAEYPAWDGRTFGQTALRADRPVNLQTADVRAEGETLAILLKGDGLSVKLCYRAYPALDVIERRAEITADESLTLLQAASGVCALPLTGGGWTAHYTAGNWAGEFRRRTAPLNEGGLCLVSDRGMSGPHLNPALLLTDGTDDEHGNAYAVMLGWSGCWSLRANQTVFGNATVRVGFDHPDWNAALQKGETLVTPPMYLCASAQGLDGLSRRLHDFERQALAPNKRPRRVLYNSWEATYFNVNAEGQMKLADRAAEMGAELFVVDDGWFGQRNHDGAGLGDWTVNPEKVPHGLEELIAHVRGLGMAFGLWVEPESVNPDSDLYRAHPDWIHRLPDREPLLLRNQYLLDLGKPEVERFALDMLRGLLRRYDISYFKWDMNRLFTDIDGQRNPLAREKHIWAIYRILDALRREYPDVDIEACSGGGARVDAGMLSRTDQFWPSDNTDPYERLFIQEGCSMCYAPAMTSCWVTDTPKDARRAGRDDLSYKFHVAMCGSLGIGADISRFTPEEMTLCKREIAAYKEMRHLVQVGDLYRLGSPASDDLHAVELVAKDGSAFALLVFLHSQRFGTRVPRVYPRALLAGARYRLSDTGEAYTSEALMRLGLQTNLKGDFDSARLYFTRVAEG